MAPGPEELDHAAIPEADRLAQEHPADPGVAHDPEWPAPASPDVDEADLLEQAMEVLGDPDEEYTPDAPGTASLE